MDFSIKNKYKLSSIIKYKFDKKLNKIKFIVCSSDNFFYIESVNLILFLDNFDSSKNILDNLKLSGIKTTKQVLKDLIFLYKKKVFIFDIKAKYKYNLSYEEVEYYMNNISYFQDKYSEDGFKFQNKIKTKKIAIIGLGGTGNALLTHFIGLGLGEIRLIDYDNVDISNIQKQFFYTLFDIGKKKTNVMKKAIKRRNPFTKVLTLNIKLDEKTVAQNKIKNFIKGVDIIIIIAADEGTYKLWLDIQKIGFELGIPIVGGASTKGLIFPLVIPNKTTCLECLFRTFIHFVDIDCFDDIKNIEYKKRFCFSKNSVPFYILMERNSYVAREIIKFLLFNDSELINSFFVSKEPYNRKKLTRHKECKFCN